MADTAKYLTELKSLLSILQGRRTMVFAYGFMFAFIACNIFLIFNPNDGSSPPWVNRIFTNSTSNSTSYKSQFSSIYSYFFPNNLTSIVENSNSSKENKFGMEWEFMAPNGTARETLRLDLIEDRLRNTRMQILLSSIQDIGGLMRRLLRELRQVLPMGINVSTMIKNASLMMLDTFVDSIFRFVVDQPMVPSLSNFAPVEEIGRAVQISSIEGDIPIDFPEGIYIRNGPNPLFGSLKSTVSILGRSSETWIEGEGMLHAVYFRKDNQGKWTVSYKNRYVESETYKLEKERKRPSFLPAIEGDSPAILAAYLLNHLRFGKVNKYISNTNVFEHSGKFYTVSENHIPQEFDIATLKTLDNWDADGAWDRPFTSHPKRIPGSGELVIMGVDVKKPFFVLGVISADGKRLSHKVDLKFKRSTLCHEIGVTEQYNVIMDFPLTMDVIRLVQGGPLIKYDKEGYARIGVMPRYGDGDSIKWFEVEPHCTFHILNCFEEANEVVVRGCRALGSIIPGPDMGHNKFEWFSRGFKPIVTSQENLDHSAEDGLFFSRVYEWRLNMESRDVKEKNLTDTNFSMDFPMINDNFNGLRNEYGYTQVIDSDASCTCGLPKYGKLAKLYFEENENRFYKEERDCEEQIKVEYHTLEENQFCSGASFISRHGGCKEDDGWIISFVHNEDTNISQVHIIDTRKFECGPVAKITLPQRVPYGFHGTFISKPAQCW
ncbi:carotenoid 9,10(9',10')-cleavage dioxygenase 1-like [Magnolia sinica]|uniref:carotenoid 9,10(9',10')-cleavage dioxygenase 1-like n=1 Tax=Magnolia sinica TaxID=86752 RepID=UPI002659D51A|nr:carotenoid 9,10(9',10')-cleavage dioxygenase 1-like [Magnolia sinica]